MTSDQFGSSNEPHERLSAQTLGLGPMEVSEAIVVGPGTVLVLAAGFEDRALAAINRIINKGGVVMTIAYRPGNERDKIPEIREALANRGFHASRLIEREFNRFAPERFGDSLLDALKEAQATRVVVDISSMSKLLILLALRSCEILNVDTSVFYAEAAQYGPSRNDFEAARESHHLHQPSIQVYTGVHGVLRVNELSSVAMQGHPVAAIVFMSFNEVLTQALLNVVFPSRLFLINGRPPALGWREDATAWIHEQLRGEWADDNVLSTMHGEFDDLLPSRVTSTRDYLQTVSMLLELYWKLWVDYRILLAPTGSKMQAVGCYIVKAMHPDIHIEYPTPEGFLDLYSTGIGECWCAEFGALGAAVEVWRRVERIATFGGEFTVDA